MIVDEKNIKLIPGNEGRDCLGNGSHVDKEGDIVCLCDECNYMMCCFPEYGGEDCYNCSEEECPRRELNGIKSRKQMFRY